MATGFRVLDAGDAFWRPSNQMGVQNTDLAKQLEIATLGARLWRLRPGQASTRHRHFEQAELYVLLEGTGRMRVGEAHRFALATEPLMEIPAAEVEGQLGPHHAEEAQYVVD